MLSMQPTSMLPYDVRTRPSKTKIKSKPNPDPKLTFNK